MGSSLTLITMNGSESSNDTGAGTITETPTEDDPNYIFGDNGA